MEILLIAITVVSLIVACVMAAAAWRFGREDRARSAARVAALAAAAGEPEFTAKAEPVAVVPAVAAVPAAVRPAESEPVAVNASRPWAPARVSAFSTRPSVVDHSHSATVDDLPLSHAPMGDAFLGSAVATPESSGRQRGLAIAAMFLLVALLAGGYWTVFGSRSSGVSAAPGAAAHSPLELISLRHERRGPRLAVTGLVRNPGAGAPVDKLAAVVFLFDQQGGFISSARANVDFLKLAPGDESPFVIATDAPDTVARYRVSFRDDAGVVPHVDRRGQEPIAATGALR